ncbi:MAG: MBL fold metallo-hydrolase [Candidatus Aminicenantaceae bacterium]
MYQTGRRVLPLASGILCMAALTLLGQQQDRPAQYRQEPAQLSAHQITDSVYEVRGGSGANAGFILTDTEVLVVDAKMNVESAQDMLASIRELTDKPIKRLLITHSDGDHINGIPGFPRAVGIIAHGNSLKYMGEVFKPESGAPMRTGQTFAKEMVIHSGPSLVRLLYFGPAHTEGDAVVYIPAEKVVFLGDLIFIGRDPLIHKHKNGNSLGLVKVLKSVLELDAEIFLHGHGAPAGRENIKAFIAGLEDKQNGIRSLIEEGKSLEEVKTIFKVEDSPASPGRTPRPSLVEIIYTEIKESKLR